MPETTFTDPDLTTFLGLDALGLTAVGLHLTAERAVIECRMPIGFEDPFCKACGAQGVSRGTVARHLAHVPVGWRPTQLVVRVRRFACTHCCRVWRQDTSALAQPRARLTRSSCRPNRETAMLYDSAMPPKREAVGNSAGSVEADIAT